MDRFLQKIGSALAYLREQAGLSQHSLAAKTKRKIQPRLSEIEAGKVGPSSKTINEYLKHCHADELDLADAFLGPDPPEEELLRRALRVLRVGELPPKIETLALEQLRNQRQTLLEVGRAPEEEDELILQKES